MRKILVISSILLIIIFATACNNGPSKKESEEIEKDKIAKRVSLSMSDVYNDVDELYENSPYIIRGTGTGKTELIKHTEVYFTIREIKVTEIIKGTIDKKITLLQTLSEQDPEVKEDDDVLLFLKKYDGPVHDDGNTYTCVGLGQGQYKINDNKFEPTFKLNAQLINDFNSRKDILKDLREKKEKE